MANANNLQHSATSSTMPTAIKSHGTIDTVPREIYGTGPEILRIGNGGAGKCKVRSHYFPDRVVIKFQSLTKFHDSLTLKHIFLSLGATGLIGALCNDYLSTLPITPSGSGSTSWICNHSRNTQLALLHGDIDIALTYERSQERLAESEGWSRTVGCIFHDHFCVAGPASDSGDIFTVGNNLHEAFKLIAEKKVLFYSRADMSATMWKERGIWESIGLKPWRKAITSQNGTDDDRNQDLGNWYYTNELSPADAVIAADQAGAYLLTDRSTLLSMVRAGKVHNTTVFVEPDDPSHVLMNSCFASVATSAAIIEERNRVCESFLHYLQSERGQEIVARFGTGEEHAIGKGNTFPFFAKISDGFASTFLRGGRPDINRKWTLRDVQT